MTRKRFLESAAALLLILTSEAILYRKVVRLWWMYDDPFQLRLVRDVALGSLLSTKDFYGGASVFTPLLIGSLKADYLLFGTAAHFFYAHQLASFAIALLLEYCLLRLWCSPLPSLSAVVVTTSDECAAALPCFPAYLWSNRLHEFDFRFPKDAER